MAFSFGLIVGSVAAVQMPAPPTPVSPPMATPALHRAEALAPFYARLRERGDRPLHIIQIGDSHTSADAITNGLRAPLQARFGNGGRGVVAPGRPYTNYVTWNVTASQSGPWAPNGWTSSAPGLPRLGLSGFTQTARAAGATIGLAMDGPDHGFDRFAVCALTGPGAGAVTLRIGDMVESWALDAPSPGAACRTLESPAPVSSASLVTHDRRPVSITSVATFRRGGGAIVSNLGVIGAQLSNFGGTDERVLRAELDAYRPDLIILAFGTNEGFDRRVSIPDYEAGLRAEIARLRRLAGSQVPILLVGAPDAATRDPAAAGGDCGGGFYTPALLGQVRTRQRAVARELGLAFWDWEVAMGGRCSSRRWNQAGQMRDDHIHFRRDGGDRIGRMLFDDLMRGAETPARDPL